MIKQTNIKSKTRSQLVEIIDSYEKHLEIERRYHFILDNMMEGFQLIGYDWRYLYVNDIVVSQSKFSREELVGATMMEKYPGIENSDMFKMLKDCMEKRVACKMTNEFNFPDGSVGWFELSMQPTREGVFILSNDITDRKRAELQKSEYIKNLEEMIFITSHKVRPPIAHILGLANLLNKKADPADTTRLFDYMKQSAESLDLFTKELTEYILKIKHQNNEEF